MAESKPSRLHKVKSVPLLNRFSGWINSKKGSKGLVDKSSRNYAEGPSTQKNTSSPPPDDLSSGDLPRNILAFRTIMKLLHNIQDRDFEITQSEESYKKLRSAEVAELKISNAFATVAVTTHQVVAVATNQCIHPKMLKVVASIQSFDDNHYTAPPPSKGSTRKCPVWTFTTNSRWSERSDPDVPLTAEPAMCDAKTMADINLDQDAKIKECSAQQQPIPLSEDEKIKIYAAQYW